MSSSDSLFERACRVIPGGVNSPVRAFKAVGGHPVFIASASGARVQDVDGKSYIDYVGSWGPMILGHAHPAVLEALAEALGRGTSFGAPTAGEVEFAELLCGAVPGLDMLRLVSSGTEACMSALRLARAHTGRDAIVKFAGCYHGHADSLLVKAGSGAATFGVPSSGGVPAGLARETLVAPYNDIAGVRALVSDRGADEIAAIIVEPVAGNMGVIPPAEGFLIGLRRLCDETGILLIIDEVMTGFRVAWGGAQMRYDVVPDLSCWGKIVGGGLPLAAFGGKRAIMESLAPLGPCYQAGTLSGNPLAVAAGLATIRALQERSDAYERLEELGARLQAGLDSALAETGISGCTTRVGAMITLFFTEAATPTNFDQVAACDHERFGLFFRGMLERGVALPPSGYEAWFLSLAHDEAAIDATIAAAKETLASL